MKTNEGFKTLLASLMALAAVLSALVAWRAAAATSMAAVADAAGLSATLNAEAARSLESARLYRHYAAYTDFVRYQELGRLLDMALLEGSGWLMDTPTDTLSPDLTIRRDEALDTAASRQFFMLPRYLRPDGYDGQREFGEAWAEAARRQDLNPEPHFAQAELWRMKASLLVGALAAESAALLSFTLANALQRRARYAATLAGLLPLLAGLAMAVHAEWFL